MVRGETLMALAAALEVDSRELAGRAKRKELTGATRLAGILAG